MKPFRNFLLCTDFSDDANHALSCAVHLAAVVDAALFLLHVTEDSDTESQSELQDRMNNVEAAFFTRSNVPFTWLMKTGDIEKCIEQTVQEQEIDLIILGIRGYKGERELLKGSITANLMEKRLPAILGIPRYTPANCFTRVGIAVDTFESLTRESFKTIRKLAEACDSRIALIHVQVSDDEIPERFDEKFREFFGDRFLALEEVRSTDVMAATEAFVGRNSLELLVLFHSSATDHAHHRSLTKQWIFKTTIPLLILPRH